MYPDQKEQASEDFNSDSQVVSYWVLIHGCKCTSDSEQQEKLTYSEDGSQQRNKCRALEDAGTTAAILCSGSRWILIHKNAMCNDWLAGNQSQPVSTPGIHLSRARIFMNWFSSVIQQVARITLPRSLVTQEKNRKMYVTMIYLQSVIATSEMLPGVCLHPHHCLE